MKKYKLLKKDTIKIGSKTLFRIQATVSFGSVVKGELGGYIESEKNLEQMSGDAWVSGDAQVYGDAWVHGDAQVSDNARVYGNAWVSGDARVYGNAQVSGDARVSDNARVSGNARVSAKASFTAGWFIGGDDSEKITEITEETGSTYWKNQYVLGDYKIESIDEEESQETLLSGKEVDVIIDGKSYKAVIK